MDLSDERRLERLLPATGLFVDGMSVSDSAEQSAEDVKKKKTAGLTHGTELEPNQPRQSSQALKGGFWY